jgi:hypothetical protein
LEYSINDIFTYYLTGYEPSLTQMTTQMDRQHLFDGSPTSWDLFRRRFFAYIAECHPLVHPVLTEVSARPENNDQGHQAAWDKLNVKLYNQLLMALQNRAASFITAATDGDGMAAWRMLKREFENNTAPRINVLHEQLLSLPTAKDLTELGEILDRIVQLKRQLKELRVDLPDTLMIARIMKSIPISEKHLTVYLEEKSLDDSIKFLKGRIPAAGDTPETPRTDTALRATFLPKNKPPRNNFNNPKIKRNNCKYCSSDAHVTDDCPKLTAWNNNKAKYTNHTKQHKFCYMCGSSDHDGNHCPDKPKPKPRHRRGGQRREEEAQVAEDTDLSIVAVDSVAPIAHSLAPLMDNPHT